MTSEPVPGEATPEQATSWEGEPGGPALETPVLETRVPGEQGVGNSRFFQRTGPHSLAAVVDAAGAEAPPRRLMFRGVAPLAVAEAADVSFFDNRKYLPALRKTRAGAVIVHPNLADNVPASAVPILTSDVYAAWARVATLFHQIGRAHV